MTNQKQIPEGLTTDEAKLRLLQYGKNEPIPPKKENFLHKVLHVIAEPMFLLLLVAAVIYFLLGEARDGAIMLVFVLGIIGIDVFQEWKTDKTLNALKDLSAPHIKVIRDGAEQIIASSELVPGDLMIIHEGVKIPADGVVVKANDLCVDESSLTGEALGVWKTEADDRNDAVLFPAKDCCYAGTLVTQGYGVILVQKTGVETEYGKIAKNVAKAPEIITPLQLQTGKLVKISAGIAAVLFAAVGAITYINLPDHLLQARITESILGGITLAMAMIPEEFPVILTVFLSMGAWRLAKKESLVRKLPAVETLGAVSVLCVDKTGTVTMNQMTVQEVFPQESTATHLCETMGLACETEAFDPMEKAMLRYCEQNGLGKEELFNGSLISEYSFTNETKMMGHVWERNGSTLVAAKGSPEKILSLCNLTAETNSVVQEQLRRMSGEGLRVIAVAEAILNDQTDIPAELSDCHLTLVGLIGLCDPPRESVKEDIKTCTQAGIRVVMITGDNGLTASSIANKIGMPGADHVLTGEQIDGFSNEELREKVKNTNIFSRVVPEHKMRIVKALQENGEVVAMTGDGVNDAPALKYADIGIAMGKRGSEVSREAADLILLDDNFSTIVDTVKDGRRIYDNIRKAVGYVFTIHIPIALASLIAPLLRITPSHLLLLPLHVVLLELIIDPTCSIVLERQPAERDILQRPPRKRDETIMTPKAFLKSILQGLVIFAASFTVYLVNQEKNAALARSMGLAVIILANLFLVQVNSSDKDIVFRSMKRILQDKVMCFVNLGMVLGLLLILYSPINQFLKLAPLSLPQFCLVFILSAVSVLWYEIVKLILRLKKSGLSK